MLEQPNQNVAGDRAELKGAAPSKHQLAKSEEQIFWLLISVLNYPLRNYYVCQAKPAEGDANNSKDNKYLEFQTQPPLVSGKLNGLKADIMLINIIIKEYLPGLNNRFNELSLPVVEILFSD